MESAGIISPEGNPNKFNMEFSTDYLYARTDGIILFHYIQNQ